MKFSVNWLREFVELPPSIDALAELLTMSGVEIEGIQKRGADFDKVVVAQITDSKPHPNADRLTVCVVDDGSGTKRQIVCGAKNYRVGDKVPLALPGAELTGGLKIRASKLRGVESEGMLCSAKELGVAGRCGRPSHPVARGENRHAHSRFISTSTPFLMSRSHRIAVICSAISAWHERSRL
jgi:phenylalanyl-tRNA synthetase beta chain